MESDIKDLEDRLKKIIHSVCNVVGCKECGLSWGEQCSATELERKIMKLKFNKSYEKNNSE